MSHELIPPSAFKSKLLDKEYHERLLADLHNVIAIAGVPMSAVWSRLSVFCTPEEIEWVKTLRSSDDAGLLFASSKFPISVEEKMMAIVGVCLRNYTDARMMALQEVTRRVKMDTMPSCTVLLIPNFCLDKTNGGDVPSWEVTGLMGLLIDRMSKGLKTILYATSMPMIEKQYGESFKSHFELKYSIATPDGITAPVNTQAGDTE